MINPAETALPVILAEGEIGNFPLRYQVACIVLTGLFLWAFSVARDPRGWRRLYQMKFGRRDDFSVNKNKRIDETIRKWGVVATVFFLVIGVAALVGGITSAARSKKQNRTEDEPFHAIDVQKAGVHR